MQTPRIMFIPVVVMLILTAIGCSDNENTRLAEMAERNLERQADLNRLNSKLQQEVAAGSRLLVAADAEARKEMVAWQRATQAERSEIGRQRDIIEDQRRDLAAQRRLDPIIAAAIMNIGLLLACLLPLILCWRLLSYRPDPADDSAIVEILLEDLVAGRPLLLPQIENQRSIGVREINDERRLPDDSEPAGDSD